MQILNAAESAAGSGHSPSDMTILMTPQGIRMIAGSDWPLESLQLHHGAEMAYRVSQSAVIVRVEGRAGSRTCLFETVKPEQAGIEVKGIGEAMGGVDTHYSGAVTEPR